MADRDTKPGNTHLTRLRDFQNGTGDYSPEKRAERNRLRGVDPVIEQLRADENLARGIDRVIRLMERVLELAFPALPPPKPERTKPGPKKVEKPRPLCGRCHFSPCVADQDRRSPPRMEEFFKRCHPAEGYTAAWWDALSDQERARWRCKAERSRRGMRA